MLYTKSILKSKSSRDGLRVSVMSRHTLNDGKTQDTRITIDSYDKWLKELAPPNELVRDYYKGKLDWNEYSKKYLSFLRQEDVSSKVKELAKEALEKDITLLCIEEIPNFCHRRILAEECQRYEPMLKVENV